MCIYPVRIVMLHEVAARWVVVGFEGVGAVVFGAVGEFFAESFILFAP